MAGLIPISKKIEKDHVSEAKDFGLTGSRWIEQWSEMQVTAGVGRFVMRIC